MPRIDLNHLELLTGRLQPQLATYTKGLTDRIKLTVSATRRV